MKTNKLKLSLGVASTALIAGLATPANAACTTDGTTVTCDATSTVDEVQAAISAVPGNDLTLINADTGEVVAPGNFITTFRSGSVAFDNAGTMTGAGGRIYIDFYGDSTAADNDFAIDNSGTIEGSISVYGAGGDVSINNSGYAESLDGRAVGNVAIDVSGATGSDDYYGVIAIGDTSTSVSISGELGTLADDVDPSSLGHVYARSRTIESDSSSTSTTDAGVTTTVNESTVSDTGGSTSVDVAETGLTGFVYAYGGASSDVAVDGQVGASDQTAYIDAVSRGNERESMTTTVSDGTDTSVDYATSTTQTGGAASIAVGETGVVHGNLYAEGVGGADVSVAGQVGEEGGPRFYLEAASSSNDSTYAYSYTSTPDSYDYSNMSTNSTVGGDASVTVADGASVNANVYVSGFASANATIDAALGDSGSAADVYASSYGADSSSYYVSSTDYVTGDNSYSYGDTSVATGGTATISIGADGSVGTAQASGQGGADVMLDGMATSVTANADATDNSYDVAYDYDAASGTDTSMSDSTSTASGGAASVVIGEDGEVMNVVAYGDTAATIDNAGLIADGAMADARADDYANGSTQISMPGEYSYSSYYTSSEHGGDAAIDNSGLIGEDPNGYGYVVARGGSSASVVNTGRINGYVDAMASMTEYSSEYAENYTQDTDAVTGVQTNVYESTSSYSTTSMGGDVSIENGEGAIITRGVYGNGAGGVTNVNDGIVVGSTFLVSSADDGTSDSMSGSTTTYTPGADGGWVYDSASSSTSTSASAGGDVSGVYAGSNGAVQFGPDGGASDGSVTQIADGNSDALVSGLIIGSFNGEAGSYSQTEMTEQASTSVYDSSYNLVSSEYAYAYSSEIITGDSESSLDVMGGTITGDATVDGDALASVTIDEGGAVDGWVSAGVSGNATSGYLSGDYSYSEYDGGAFVGSMSESANSYMSTAGTGMADVTIGDGSVGGSVVANGGTGGASVAVGADGEVGGYAYAYSNVVDRTGGSVYTSVSDGVDTVATYSSTDVVEAAGGDVTLDIAGVVGNGLGGAMERGSVDYAYGSGLYGDSNAGDVSATVSGQVAGDIWLSASGDDYASYENETYVNGMPVVGEYGYELVSAGGSASLVADAADPALPANFGDVSVDGDTSASVEVTSGTVIAGAQGFNFVDVTSFSRTYSTEWTYDYVEGTYVDNGAYTYTGGAAMLDNAGEIGFGTDDMGFYENVQVYVGAVDTADVVNSGTIFGSVYVDTVNENETFASENGNIGDVTEYNLVTRTYEAIGGTSTFANTGEVTGNVVMHAGEGMGANDGLIRGTVELGTSVDNYTTEQLDTLTQFGEEVVIAEADEMFAQNYSFDQNDVLMGGVYVGGAFGNIDESVMTSAISATINLNDGSLTWGNIEAEYDEVTGERFTMTDLNLVGSGQLGEASEGSRVLGVETVTKSGDGNFLVIGTAHVPVGADNAYADYTFDIGLLSVEGGELELAVNEEGGIFSIRGDVMNDASIVMGTRNADGSISGTEIYQLGNFEQTAGGNLAFGVTSDMVMANGFWTVDGDVSLEGNVEVAGNADGWFMGGETLDFMSASGDVYENASASYNGNLNFVTFDVETREEDGRTILYVEAERQGYDTVVGDDNDVAAGEALTDALPGLINTVANCDFDSVIDNNCQNAADLLGILEAFESELTADEVARAIDEMASGDFYGSLVTNSTTRTFVDAITHRRVPMDAKGPNLWFAPAATFLNVDGTNSTGARAIDVENYGGTMGFGYMTGKGEIGFGFGLNQTTAAVDGEPIEADAETWMAGIYGRHAFGDVAVGMSAVYGWSDWEASRAMPFLGRTAEAAFSSTEMRFDATAEYQIGLGETSWLAPFGMLEVRRVDFDGFTEEGAGGINLIVEEMSDTYITPSLGVRLGGAISAGSTTLRPEASVSYSFGPDLDTSRMVAFTGAPASKFRLQGVDMDNYFTFGGGLFADFNAKSTGFLRGQFTTGGGFSSAELRAGISIGL